MIIFGVVTGEHGWSIMLLGKALIVRGEPAAAFFDPIGKYVLIETTGINYSWNRKGTAINIPDIVLGKEEDYLVKIGEPRTVTTGLGTVVIVESRREHKRPRWFKRRDPEVYWTFLEVPDDLKEWCAANPDFTLAKCDNPNEALEKLYDLRQLFEGDFSLDGVYSNEPANKV